MKVTNALTESVGLSTRTPIHTGVTIREMIANITARFKPYLLFYFSAKITLVRPVTL